MVEGGVHGDYNNESCGDYVNISLKIVNGVIEDAKFDGEGCSLSMVTADLLCGYIKGKSVSEVEDNISYEDLIELLGFIPSIGRVNCVRSSLNALESVLKK